MTCAEKAIGKGAFGTVSKVPGSPFCKKVSDWSHPNNLTEAIAMTALKDLKLPNVICANAIRVTENNRKIEICMERGLTDLRTACEELAIQKRMGCIMRWIADMVRGLHGMHEHGWAHCDLKPSNVVVTLNGTLKIIDFGSARLWRRSGNGDVMCTYAFCAPEAMTSGGSGPTPACDAYSLGATLHHIAYSTYLFDVRACRSFEQVRALHLRGGVALPATRPEGMPDAAFHIMMALLRPDPAERVSIRTLHGQFFGPPKSAPRFVILDPPRRLLCDVRAAAIDELLRLCEDEPRHFGLAANIMDRYAAAKGATRNPFGGPTLDACRVLAARTLDPGLQRLEAADEDVAINVARTLEFRLYADTADWILVFHYGHESLDMQLLTQVMKQRTTTADVVLAYQTALRYSSDGGSTSSEGSSSPTELRDAAASM